MQAGSAAQGAGRIPGRSKLGAALATVAVLVIAAMVALMVRVPPVTTSGVGAEDAVSKAGAVSMVVHDDAGNVHRDAVLAVVHDDAGSIDLSAAPAVIHDDAGDMNLR